MPLTGEQASFKSSFHSKKDDLLLVWELNLRLVQCGSDDDEWESN